MKHVILALVSAVVLLSCNNGTGNNSGTNPSDTLKKSVPLGDVNLIAPVCIPVDTANKMVKKYRDSIGNNAGPSSFMLDATALRQYLDQNKDVTKLEVYMAMNDTGKTLIYIGAKDTVCIGNNKDTTIGYLMVRYYMPGDTLRLKPMVFDQATPCPICDKMGFSN